MSRSITIRGLPDDVRDRLARRAAAEGKSLQEYLRGFLIELAGKPDPDVLVARVRERKTRMQSSLGPEAILEHRDAGRR